MYRVLKEESKTAIQEKFSEQKSEINLPNGWDSAGVVFQKARKALVGWRYAVNSTNKSATIFPHALYVATVSVYRTIPIFESYGSWSEVRDPALKAKILARTANR